MNMKPQVYIDAREAGAMQKYHRRVREHRPSAMYDLVRMAMTGIYLPLNRVKSIDSHFVPTSGPVISVPNHFSFIDHFYTGFPTRRKIQFMAKSQLFKPPMDFVFSHGGVFPVMRGKSDEAAFDTARGILARGGMVQLYAEGGRSRTYYPKVAKRGPGILALTSGAPVVPVAIYGSQFMRDYRRHGMPKVIVRYGHPIVFDKTEDPSRDQQIEAARAIFSRVTDMWYELDAEYEPQWRRRERERTGELPGNMRPPDESVD
ncbi:MAG: 1-acyl-sn-glycerol-3-phosphate acyltransferase [Actinobacteria bacterium]|nr:1-acyl-sn-glycerol-3-phosphate acyltransferase [Actinomycetota bacterium]